VVVEDQNPGSGHHDRSNLLCTEALPQRDWAWRLARLCAQSDLTQSVSMMSDRRNSISKKKAARSHLKQPLLLTRV
jgi:hypothetical protein